MKLYQVVPEHFQHEMCDIMLEWCNDFYNVLCNLLARLLRSKSHCAQWGFLPSKRVQDYIFIVAMKRKSEPSCSADMGMKVLLRHALF